MNSKKKYSLTFKIWQIFYNELSKKEIDSGFIPYDNCGIQTKGFENDVILDVWINKRKEWMNADYVGVLSWRFYQKTKLKSDEIFKLIAKSNEAVISLSPKSMSGNNHSYSREQYKDIIELCKVVDDANIFDFKLLRYPLKKNIWCNYWVASPEIFDLYCCTYLNKVVTFFNTTKDLRAIRALEKTINHRRGVTYSVVTFFLEGLFSTFLHHENIKFIEIS